MWGGGDWYPKLPVPVSGVTRLLLRCALDGLYKLLTYVAVRVPCSVPFHINDICTEVK